MPEGYSQNIAPFFRRVGVKWEQGFTSPIKAAQFFGQFTNKGQQ
jgi:hypothetical protein